MERNMERQIIMKSMDGSNGNYTEGVGLQLNNRNFYHLSKYYIKGFCKVVYGVLVKRASSAFLLFHIPVIYSIPFHIPPFTTCQPIQAMLMLISITVCTTSLFPTTLLSPSPASSSLTLPRCKMAARAFQMQVWSVAENPRACTISVS